MKVIEQKIVVYEDKNGKEPFYLWLNSLKDKILKQIVYKRLTRVREGNFGDCKSLKDDIFELRIHYGSGHRIYIGRLEECFVILLSAGDKSTQVKDIKIARVYFDDFKKASR